MSFDPKRLYRRLDQLIEEIDAGAATQEWFDWLVNEILDRFGDQLCLTSGRLYEEVPGGYRVRRQFRSVGESVEGVVLPHDYPPLALVREEGVVIFDREDTVQDEAIEGRLGGLESVGLDIEAKPRMILAFGLDPGWEHDRLDLAMRTIRNALNRRLSDIHLEYEFDQVAELQASLVSPEPPSFPGYSIAARSIPADLVGGDLIDFIELSHEFIGLALGDASGHGLPAALVARDVVTGLRMAAERDLKITATIRKLNQVIARSLMSTRFVSLFYGELESNGNLFYVNAGHQPGLLFRPASIEQLGIGGSILGPMEDAQFKRGFAHVDRGATLVLVTDGVLEHKSPGGSYFGDEGVIAAMQGMAGAAAEDCLEAILAAAGAHGEGRRWEDDTTVMVVSRDPRAGGPPTRRFK